MARSLAPEDLVEHAAWLRQLARAVATGDAEGDEVAQEAALAALRAPPGDGVPVRPWLARVVRNAARMRWRGEQRRARRERQASAGATEEAPSPEQLLDRARLHRLLGELIVELEEPYRSTLLLRYFEEMSAARIAEVQGIPSGTVRWRLSEGVSRLRERMDRATGAQSGWRRALVAPGVGAMDAATTGTAAGGATASGAAGSGAATASAATKGALLMKTNKMIAAAAVLLVVAGAGTALVVRGAKPGGDGKGATLGQAPTQQSPSAAGSPEGRPGAARPGPAGAPPAPPAEKSPVQLVAAVATPDPRAAHGSVEGRVVSWSTGAPVAGAELVLATADGAALSLVTDADGVFRYEPAAGGGEAAVTVATVSAAGYLPFAPEWGHSPVELVLRPGVRVRNVVISLTPAIDYTGRVVGPDGAPVAGARVRIIDLPAGEQSLVAIADRFVTDARGEFVFHVPDFALLEARHDGFGPGRARLDNAAQVSHRLVIRLEPAGVGEALGAGEIAGVVVDEGGAAMPGVVVRGVPETDPAAAAPDLGAAARAVTGDDGGFVLRGLDPGDYLVAARDADHAPAEARVESGTRGVRLVLSPGAVVRGRVLAAATRAPLPAATVIVSQKSGLSVSVAAVRSVVDPDGWFSISGLAPGAYEVSATAAGHAPAPPVGAEAVTPPAAPGPIEILVPSGGVLSGVVRGADGAPLEHARVTVEGGAGRGSSAVPIPASVVTSADGRFELSGLAPGRRSVLVGAYGHHGRVVGGLAVTEGARIGPIEITLEPTRDGEAPAMELVGIGVRLSAATDDLLILEAIAGGGAAEAGLAGGDRITAVDGTAVAKLGFDAAVQAIRGVEGTTVRLGVQKAGATAEVVVVRRRIRG